MPIRPGLSLRSIFSSLTGVDEFSPEVDWRGLYDLACIGRYPSIEGVICEMCGRLGLYLDEKRLPELARQRANRHLWGFSSIEPGVLEVLRLLRDRGVRTALLSNSDPEIISEFRNSPLNGLFEATVFSHEVGLAKPDPAIFQLVCERLGLLPEQCVFIADGSNREFDGARAVGMKTVLAIRYADSNRLDEWDGLCDAVIENLDELPELLGIK
jgi:putative hydrolase of the HAD superfamily